MGRKGRKERFSLKVELFDCLTDYKQLYRDMCKDRIDFITPQLISMVIDHDSNDGTQDQKACEKIITFHRLFQELLNQY